MVNFREIIDVEPQKDEALETLWVVTLGDMMTTLTIFFLILFAFNTYISKRYKTPEAQSNVKLEEELKKFGQISFNRDETRLQLPDSILFSVNSADLRPKAEELLHGIASVLRETDKTIVVEGHTDNYPIINTERFRSNWHLSSARAFSVVKYLIENEKIPPARISGWGYAEYKPIATFETIEGRAKNRRIEIVILNEKI